MSTPEKLVCDECGGENVTVDATVSWDIDTQKWVVEDVHDYSWCSDCDNEVNPSLMRPIDSLKQKAIMAIKKEEKDGISK